jgi:hypothetical protein
MTKKYYLSTPLGPTKSGLAGFEVILGKKKKKKCLLISSNFCKQKSPHFMSGTFVMLWDFFLGLTRFGWAENVWFRKT